ncbi:hypothetical protein [Pelagicoccus sp. SDUM812003]|uniref:hypothetical protein n=1 Tax=Pelagicoccus sp. SDUM812003 TaxID=3041267 RepID=UPI0028104FD0|nr:hypothetical protein [Pelagicoccus sp. SDUM812003]MDQ8202800.1 hypothetical protein [Pelagicoccus sp. SDUM812003]
MASHYKSSKRRLYPSPQSGDRFRYHCCGLAIESDFALPELGNEQTFSHAPDLVFLGASVPDRLERPLLKRPRFEACPGKLLGRIESAGRFLVDGPNTIKVELERPDAIADLTSYLLGVGLATVLSLRGIVPLHASAVEVDGAVVAFAGDSGSGKSTISSYFETIGHPIVSDDLLPIRVFQGKPPVCDCGPRVHRLDPSSASLLGRDPREIPFVEDKHHFHNLNWSNQASIPIRAIFAVQARPEIEAHQLMSCSGKRKLSLIASSIFKRHWTVPLGTDSQLLQNAIIVASSVPVIRLRRPSHKPTDLETLRQQIEDCLTTIAATS